MLYHYYHGHMFRNRSKNILLKNIGWRKAFPVICYMTYTDFKKKIKMMFRKDIESL